ncbi:hypothetical protein LOTGIDRAFT_152607 [Lottia gigantea]|uniref:Endonuclease/exonuclease/phosphatase domain-containing protein n=1 Tax=Lottia gigantea TaxID=225164 RepID=V4AUP8_LOTGI|nr:hypothetical protein LOTGIDRAFT_152607 [Lottia gigantea]ESO97516.1 hypothetical protein LOTGIDRAFT_152607 [Lottia gigantea]
MDNEPLCAEIANEYVKEVMTNSHTAESDQNNDRKRFYSDDSDVEDMSGAFRERKKSKSCFERDGESSEGLNAQFMKFANSMQDSFKKLNMRIDDLEDNLEKKIVGRISQSINAKIEESVKNRVTAEVTIMKAEISENIKTIEHKIENLKMTREPVDQNVESSRTKNIVIKNLLPCQAELVVIGSTGLLGDELLDMSLVRILEGNDKLNIPGFDWFGRNRTDVHRNAKRGSGGVGILVNSEILGLYDATVLDDSKEDILWLKLSNKTLRNSDLCICACYVPPSNSTRAGDVDTFFNDLLQQVYCFRNEGILYMAGDFNARCGDEQDFIAGMDDIPGRDIIDTTSNLYGDKLIDFLTSCNLCMLNGRVYSEHGSNNFTCVSKRGKFVVDYAITTHEQLSNCKSRSVYLMSDLINLCGIQFEKSVPDHGPIIWTIDVQNATSNADHFPVLNKTIRYDTRKIPRDFLTNISGVEEKIIGLE